MYITKIEKNFTGDLYTEIMYKTWPFLPLFLVSFYVVIIIYGKHYMKNRPPLMMDKMLKCWNLSMTIFSFCGMTRTIPTMLINLKKMTFRDTLCLHPSLTYGNGVCGLWTMLFCYSKIIELIDTFFLILRKRPVQFLHWYHHMTVLLFCWYSYAMKSPNGIYFITMNYTIHTYMYGYFLICNSFTIIKKYAYIITIAQISQMIIGIIVSILSYRYYLDDKPCSITFDNILVASLLYGSYLYLFGDFFIKRFLTNFKPKNV